MTDLKKLVIDTTEALNVKALMEGPAELDQNMTDSILRTALLKAKLEEVEEMIHPSDRPRSYGSFLSYADDRIAELRAQIKEAEGDG